MHVGSSRLNYLFMLSRSRLVSSPTYPVDVFLFDYFDLLGFERNGRCLLLCMLDVRRLKWSLQQLPWVRLLTDLRRGPTANRFPIIKLWQLCMSQIYSNSVPGEA